MKRLSFFILVISILFSSCGIKEQRQQLEQKMTQLQQKEQELLLKEYDLNQREQILEKKEKSLDSVLLAVDTISAAYPGLPGLWSVKMVCTEANCSGFALGDTKTEQWEIGFQNNEIIARALNNKKVISRVYVGRITSDKRVLLKAQSTSDDPDEARNLGAQITVLLKTSGENELKGVREIVQKDDCHVSYSIKMNKIR